MFFNRFKPIVPTGIHLHKDITYMHYNGSPLYLDLYIPKGDGPFPVIVWFHSGAWKTLNKSCIEQGVIDQIMRNYAVASIGHSLSMREKWPAQLLEARAAVRWLRSHAGEYRLDPGKLIAWGMSSGGHIAGMLAVLGNVDAMEGESDGNNGIRSNVQAAVLWSAPVDLSKLEGNAYRAAAELLGSEKTITTEKAKPANPIVYIHSGCPPFFIAHGAKDKVVDIGQSRMLFEALKDAGINAVLREYPDYGHTDKRFNLNEHLSEIEAFVDFI